MPRAGKLKIKTAIGTTRSSREYTSDYAFLALLNDNEKGERWEQEPANYLGGYGLFKVGLGALRLVAEQEGAEAFKRAARAAMDVMGIMDPALTEEERAEKGVAAAEFVKKFAPKTRAKKSSSKKD